MSIWRVLVIYKWRRFAPPNKHTPQRNAKQLNQLQQKRKFGANPLAKSFANFFV